MAQVFVPTQARPTKPQPQHPLAGAVAAPSDCTGFPPAPAYCLTFPHQGPGEGQACGACCGHRAEAARTINRADLMQRLSLSLALTWFILTILKQLQVPWLVWLSD